MKENFYYFLSFIKKRKLWFLLPLFIILFLLSSLIVLTSGSIFAPLLYTLF
jgi:hypothetical protein